MTVDEYLKLGESSIENLYLSTRTERALKRAGIFTIAQILALDLDKLYDIPDIGKKGVEVVLRRLAQHREMQNTISKNPLNNLSLTSNKAA